MLLNSIKYFSAANQGGFTESKDIARPRKG